MMPPSVPNTHTRRSYALAQKKSIISEMKKPPERDFPTIALHGRPTSD